MSYYYLTTDDKIYKSVGARRVCQILQKNKKKYWRMTAPFVYCPYIPVITTTTVMQKNRSLSARWTVEIAQDLQAMNGITLSSSEIRLVDKRDKIRWSRRNIIPIQTFRAHHHIVCESKDFSRIVFELASREL